MTGESFVIKMNDEDRYLLAQAVRAAVLPKAIDSNGVMRDDYINGHEICRCSAVMRIVGKAIASVISSTSPKYILGVELAGGAPSFSAMAFTDSEQLEFAYVRKSIKKYGFQSVFSASIMSGATALVVDDIISTGKTGSAIIESVRLHGIKVVGYVAITNRPVGGIQLLNQMGIDTFVAIPDLAMSSE